jgi:hypothetical protein
MFKKVMLPFLLMGISLVSGAQSDTIAMLATKNDTLVLTSKNDTIRIGSLLIVTKKEAEDRNFKTVLKIGDASYGKTNDGELGWIKGDFKKTRIEIAKGPRKLKNLETNWWTLDLGFANYHDKSPVVYWLAANPNVLPYGPGPINPKSLSLNNKKSTNVNLWIVQQKLNLYEHKINLKYGVGVEMFNFRFEKPISFREDVVGYLKYDDVTFTKNKQISAENGKQKYAGNFNLNDWRVATIGELGVGPIRLYGSYGMTNLFNKSQVLFDMQPFALGLRFSRF